MVNQLDSTVELQIPFSREVRYAIITHVCTSIIIGCWVCDGVWCKWIQVCHCKRGWTYGKSEQSLLKLSIIASPLHIYLQVPQSRPETAFAMFEHFIKDESFW